MSGPGSVRDTTIRTADDAADWGAITVGDTMEPFVEEPLTITDFVRYQGAANDQNPIHHDAAFAQRAGYPGPFAVGMRQAGVLADYVVRMWGTDNVRRFKVQFREQAWPDDELTYAAKVVAKNEIDGQREVELDMTVTRQTGGVHILGWATFVV